MWNIDASEGSYIASGNKITRGHLTALFQVVGMDGELASQHEQMTREGCLMTDVLVGIFWWCDHTMLISRFCPSFCRVNSIVNVSSAIG